MTPALASVQSGAILHLTSNVGMHGAPVPCGCSVAQADFPMRLLSDDATETFAKHVRKHRPQGREAMEKAQEKIRKRVEKIARREYARGQVGHKCGVFPIFLILGQAFITWLAGQLFSWLWNRYTQDRAEMCAAGAGLEGDDGDD